jgi:outer membrane protein, heavy metal efflux system
MRARLVVHASATLVGLLWGCAGTPTTEEIHARDDVREIESRFRPSGAKPTLPELSAETSLAGFVLFAMLNRPQVEAAYYRWIAAVQTITSARSLPDPELNFEGDLTGLLDTLVAGLMFELRAPRKLAAAGDMAAAEARIEYSEFEAELLRTAYGVKSAYFKLAFIEDTLRLLREAVTLVGEVEAQARRQASVGRASIQDVLRAEIEREQLATRIKNLEDSRVVLRAEFALALGLDPAQTEPPTPSRFEEQAAPGAEADILALAVEWNPRLKRFEAEVDRATSRLALARAARVPDFAVGVDAENSLGSILWRPNASVTLPIWRDKIAAEIAAAESDQRAVSAARSAEQIELAAEFAALLYAYRESERNVSLYGAVLAQKARESLEVARSGYAAGSSTFLDVIEAERQLIDFETFAIDARAQRELSLAAISLLVAGVTPDGAPVLESSQKIRSATDARTPESEDP